MEDDPGRHVSAVANRRSNQTETALAGRLHCRRDRAVAAPGYRHFPDAAQVLHVEKVSNIGMKEFLRSEQRSDWRQQPHFKQSDTILRVQSELETHNRPRRQLPLTDVGPNVSHSTFSRLAKRCYGVPLHS